MAEIDYQHQVSHKPTNNNNVRLKLFGFNVSSSSQEEVEVRTINTRSAAGITTMSMSSSPPDESSMLSSEVVYGGGAGPAGASTSNSNSNSTTADGRKYECQYCCREFANSQALGGHQNAHKKERQQLKRAQLHQMQAAAARSGRITSTSSLYSRNPMVSAFAPPPHLLPASASHHHLQPSWVYMTSSSHPAAPAAAPFQISHGCHVYPSTSPVLLPSLSRFSSSSRDIIIGDHQEGRPSYSFNDGFGGGSAAGGLDLHLSLAPSAP